MLSLLHIENIAIIESADIAFEAGFNVLTGETGAGKSIVIDAISAVLGQRTSRELIRTGAKSALVTAVFTGLPQLPWLTENGFSQGEELLLQREIQGDGRNVCRLNGRPLTVAQLRELGRQLLDIHGQHDGQQLLDPACHLLYLDSFGKTASLWEDYHTAYQAMAALKKQIASLEMDEAERSRRGRRPASHGQSRRKRGQRKRQPPYSPAAAPGERTGGIPAPAGPPEPEPPPGGEAPGTGAGTGRCTVPAARCPSRGRGCGTSG